jgi:hypothetical protein
MRRPEGERARGPPTPLTGVPSKPAGGADGGALRVVHEVVAPHQADQQLAACTWHERGEGVQRAASGRRTGRARCAAKQGWRRGQKQAAAVPCGCRESEVMPCCFWLMYGALASHRRAS